MSLEEKSVVNQSKPLGMRSRSERVTLPPAVPEDVEGLVKSIIFVLN